MYENILGVRGDDIIRAMGWSNVVRVSCEVDEAEQGDVIKGGKLALNQVHAPLGGCVGCSLQSHVAF